MGACRETKDILFYIKKSDWKKAFYHIKNFDKITFMDTFMRFYCKIFGHKIYLCQFEEDGVNYH